ncbi:VOC family protein [bacterium]|jgi:predicted enzyme related to lactoylglutathione lyase|nr:VOC family protein [bacterium]MDA7680243.1 VOC family protein [bacterium]
MSAKPILAGASLGQIAINVSDIRRATTFYKETLGLKFLFDAGTMTFFDCGGVRLMLGVAEKPEFDHPSSILYFKVDGIKKHHERLSEVGVEFKGTPHLVAPMPDHDLWMAFFQDSEGNTMALMSEEPKAD